MNFLAPGLADKLVHWRRDFHAHPELGFREYRTAALVGAHLAALPGCRLRVGAEVMVATARHGAPDAASSRRAETAALAADVPAAWLARMRGGLTGLVAEWQSTRPGPTVAFRFDLDALPIAESEAVEHFPAAQGFASRAPGLMHACGHDGHTAIGLALAEIVAAHISAWSGTVRLIFQPAEEGCCGAAAMVAAGVVDDVDYFIAGHLGTAADETGLVACAATGFLATTKLDVTYRGRAAHAGLAPESGRNALLAAAALVLQLHALPRHSGGDSRINVGTLHAGSGRNVIAAEARLQLEVRGATTEVNEFLAAEARRLAEAVAHGHGVEAEIAVVGAAPTAASDAELMAIIRAAAEALPATRRVVDTLATPGSEDATAFMRAVQARGGKSVYLLVGARLAAGHHHPAFDFDEAALPHAVELLAGLAARLLSR